MHGKARTAAALTSLGLAVGLLPLTVVTTAGATPAEAPAAVVGARQARAVLVGRLTRRAPLVTLASQVVSGRVTAVTAVSKGCTRVTVTLGQGRRLVAAGTGSSGLAVAGPVSRGRLVVRVSGGGCTAAVKVTLTETRALTTPVLPRRASGYATLAGRTVTGVVTRTRPSVAVRAAVAGGGFSAELANTACSPLTMRVTQGSRTLASGSGMSGLALAGTAARGWVSVIVTSARCRARFSVRVTAPTSATPVLLPSRSVTATSPQPVAPVAAPSPTTAPVAPAPTPSAPSWSHVPVTDGISVLSFGAVGDGATDDTAAVQAALDALRPGDTLVFPAGRTFVHTDVLALRVPRVTLGGQGTLLATKEARSSVLIDADDVTVDGLTLAVSATSKRWETYEQMKLRLGPRSGIVVRAVSIDGSAAAGVYVGGSSGFTLDHVTVQNTRADGIHMTEAANHGQVIAPILRNTGDDGVAVVSYANQSGPCHHITVTSPRFYGQPWGRGFSVVGGEDITYTDVYAEHSNGAAIYISAESSWNTMGVKRVLIDGGTLVSSNDNVTSDHGAILLYNGQAGFSISDVTVQNITVRQTRSSASRQVGVLSDGAAVQRRISLRNIAIVGGPSRLFAATVAASSYNTTGWTYNGARVADKVGWV